MQQFHCWEGGRDIFFSTVTKKISTSNSLLFSKLRLVVSSSAGVLATTGFISWAKSNVASNTFCKRVADQSMVAGLENLLNVNHSNSCDLHNEH